MPTLWVANDHAAFSLKDDLITQAIDLGFHPEDLGAYRGQSVDYPDRALALVKAFDGQENDFGLLICGSGLGMSMVANRYAHIRAAVCHDVTSAHLARKHNAANVLCLGARLIGIETAQATLKAFLTTPFEGGRHERRVNMF